MPRYRGSGGGRAAPKGSRPDHLRLVQGGGTGEPPDPADRFIDGDARALLAEVDPVSAEIWGSRLVAMFDEVRDQPEEEQEGAPPFELAIIERCAERADLASLVAASALAAVLPPPLDLQARRTADAIGRPGLGLRLPAWIGRIGTARPTRAWVATDRFGDQESLMIAFAVEGEPQDHLLLTLVDHARSGQATDAWIASAVDPVVAKWAEDGETVVVGLDVPDALRRLEQAVATSDRRAGDVGLRSESFAHHRPLIRARLRRAGFQ